MTRKNLWYISAAVFAVLAVGVFVWWLVASRSDTAAPYSNTNKPSASAPSTGGTDKNESDPPNDNGQTPKSYPVKVYFSKHPESDNDPGKTFSLARTSPNLGLARYAVAELLKGPTAAEAVQGYFSTVQLREGSSTCGGADFTVSVTDGTARLQFCRPFDHRGSVADGQADSAIKATLNQFESVQKIVILNSRGDCEFDLSGENMCLKQ